MSLAHFTLPTREVERTAAFLQAALGYGRDPAPGNSPVETIWLAIGGGQQLHIFYVDGFEVSSFEGEFGRHIALFWPAADLAPLKTRLAAAGAELMDPVRPTAHPRFFF